MIPEIEAARPRASGIEALCSLNNGITKSKSLLRQCSDSSMLYLVLAGADILSKCNNSRNLLKHNLRVIRNMVPLTLAEKISGVILALRSAAFCLDPSEEEAGKILRDLLFRYGSTVDYTEETTLSAIRAVCSRLHISTRKALVIEKRSIRKLLDRLGESERSRSKTKILLFFLSLLNKYGKIITNEEEDNVSAEHENPLSFSSELHGAQVMSWETLSYSIASLGNSMDGLNLPLDFSNLSLRSFQHSEPSCATSHERDTEICGPSSDSSCDTIEGVKRLLKISDESWSMMPFEKLIQLLLRFLRDARDLHDVEAQKTGCLHLLQLVQKYRNSISHMNEDAYCLLASFLDTEVAKEAISVLEVLSLHEHSGHKVTASGALVGISNILDNHIQELLEPALNILQNLSTNSDISAFIEPSDFIPKLIPLFENSTLARYCVTILKNLRDNEKARVSIAETNGCISSLVKILENGSHDDQENTVSILRSLCSHRVRYRHLLVDEGVIPGLAYVSINGNKKAKAMAKEIMQIL